MARRWDRLAANHMTVIQLCYSDPCSFCAPKIRHIVDSLTLAVVAVGLILFTIIAVVAYQFDRDQYRKP